MLEHLMQIGFRRCLEMKPLQTPEVRNHKSWDDLNVDLIRSRKGLIKKNTQVKKFLKPNTFF